MTNADVILSFLKHTKGHLCDDCLSQQSGVSPRQQVFQLCAKLAGRGKLQRVRGRCETCRRSKTVNGLDHNDANATAGDALEKTSFPDHESRGIRALVAPIEIHQKVVAYHGALAGDPHHRYRSWEHCYSFFRRTTPSGIADHRDMAALQLGFYLASWGMYRGSGFLLQRAYTVHLGVVDCLATPRFALLWERDVGAEAEDFGLIPIILAAIDAIRHAYRPFGEPTDTLVTKVILGTFGCFPACDRFFVDGFRRVGFQYSSLNEGFIEGILRFSHDNISDLRHEQARIEASSGVRYPLMKLVDMYFWQIGYEAGQDAPAAGA